MPVSTTAQNYMLAQETSNKATYCSLHTAYSSSGVNELSGGSYARQATAWGAPSGGVISLSNTPTFSVPAANTVRYIGLWDASSSGNFHGMFPNSAGNNAYAFAAGTATSIFLAPGSSYAASAPVVLFASPGSTLPSPFAAGTTYYVASPTTDTFELASSVGGGAVTVTADGAGIVQYIAPEGFVGSGTFTVSTGSLTMV